LEQEQTLILSTGFSLVIPAPDPPTAECPISEVQVVYPISNRELVNKPGTISVSGLFNFDVSFDLLELPDSVVGVACKPYTYGRLRFRQELEPSLSRMLLSSARLTLKGGGIEASIFLHGRNSFGVIGPIKDVAAEQAA